MLFSPCPLSASTRVEVGHVREKIVLSPKAVTQNIIHAPGKNTDTMTQDQRMTVITNDACSCAAAWDSPTGNKKKKNEYNDERGGKLNHLNSERLHDLNRAQKLNDRLWPRGNQHDHPLTNATRNASWDCVF